MYNAMVIRTHDQLIARIIIQALNKIIDMMRLCHMCPILFPDQSSANLAAVAIQSFQVVSDLLIQFPDFDDLFLFSESGHIVRSIEVELRLHNAFRLTL